MYILDPGVFRFGISFNPSKFEQTTGRTAVLITLLTYRYADFKSLGRHIKTLTCYAYLRGVSVNHSRIVQESSQGPLTISRNIQRHAFRS